MLQRIFKRANRRGFTVREYDLNLIKDTSSLVCCLTMFDVCHMFVL